MPPVKPRTILTLGIAGAVFCIAATLKGASAVQQQVLFAVWCLVCCIPLLPRPPAKPSESNLLPPPSSSHTGQEQRPRNSACSPHLSSSRAVGLRGGGSGDGERVMLRWFCEDGTLRHEAGGDQEGAAQDDVLEKAEGLKREGNICFKGEEVLEAVDSYAQGLRLLHKSSGEGGVGAGGISLVCGQRVSVRREGGSELAVEGMIAYDNEDGTFDIITEEGKDLDGVAASRIQPLAPHSSGPAINLWTALTLNCARCAFKLGDLHMCDVLATRVIERDGTKAAAFFIRGTARLAMPHLDDARDDLTCAVNGDPSSAEYRKALNECMQKIKSRNEGNRKMANMMLSYMRSEGVS